jgi:hypothetical protein
MVKISHETPLCLLENSREFNNYDYALPHLFDSEPGYLEYFRESKKMGRYIIMDNSLHELGHAYDTDRLLYWINEFEPDEFIVPDVWQDRDKSVVNARQWASVELPENTTKVAVVQATTLHEAATCYQTYKDLGYKKIAFSYGASYYNDVVPHPNKDLGKALGRISVISILHKIGVIEDNDRVHLLGCSVPQEFGWYQGFKFIESIDTSNPIMAALEGIRYTEFGLTQKPKANMNDCFYMFEDQIDYDILDYNLIMFATINNL